jgi:hypothetical protein
MSETPRHHLHDELVARLADAFHDATCVAAHTPGDRAVCRSVRGTDALPLLEPLARSIEPLIDSEVDQAAAFQREGDARLLDIEAAAALAASIQAKSIGLTGSKGADRAKLFRRAARVVRGQPS